MRFRFTAVPISARPAARLFVSSSSAKGQQFAGSLLTAPKSPNGLQVFIAGRPSAQMIHLGIPLPRHAHNEVGQGKFLESGSLSLRPLTSWPLDTITAVPYP